MRQIRLIFGRACSGKNYISSKYDDSFKQIVVSDVVKEISGFQTRSELLTTKDLAKQIANRLCELIEGEKFVVINGIRQSKIVEIIKRKFKDDDILMIWVDASDRSRKKRFKEREDSKDNITLTEVDRLDNELGLEELALKYEDSFIHIKN